MKRHVGYQKLRHRLSDPVPHYTNEVQLLANLVAEKKRQLSKLPEDAIAEILDVATKQVGIARLNEALMINIVANIKAVVMMEHLCGRRVDFKNDRPLPAFDTWDLEAFVDSEAA